MVCVWSCGWWLSSKKAQPVFSRQQSLYGWPFLLDEYRVGLDVAVAVEGENKLYIHWQTESHLQLVAGGTTTACLLAFCIMCSKVAACKVSRTVACTYPLLDDILAVYVLSDLTRFVIAARLKSWLQNCAPANHAKPTRHQHECLNFQKSQAR